MNTKLIEEIFEYCAAVHKEILIPNRKDIAAILTRAEQEAKEEPLEKVPHIICLAAAHHYRLRPAMTAKEWVISLVKIGDRNTKFVAHGETYWEAESKARAYLAGLPDKEAK